MDEQATTDAPVEEQAPIEAQPEATTVETPAADTAEPSEEVTTQEATPEEAPAKSDELTDWATKAGYEAPTTDLERKLLEEKRDSNKQFTQERQAEAEEKKTVNDVVDTLAQTQLEQIEQTYQNDPVMKEIGQLKVNQARQEINNAESTFYKTNPEASQYKDQITEKIVSDPVLQQMIAAGYTDRALKSALSEHFYEMRGETETTLKATGGKEALTNLQTKQRATAVKGNATSPNQAQPLSAGNRDSWYAGLTPAQRKDRAIQAKYEAAGQQ